MENTNMENIGFADIRTWALEKGIFESSNIQSQFIKLSEENGELATGISKKNKKLITDSIGDMVVVLTNIAHMHGVEIEECIAVAYNEIKSRKGKMLNGVFVKESDLK